MIKKNRGFTLIEVLVALAILGVGLTVVIELFSGGLRLGRFSQEYTKASHYARMKMEEIMVQYPLKEGIEEGECDDTFRWKIEVKREDILPTENSSSFKPPVILVQVKVNILWKSGTKEKSIGLESYKTIKLKDDEKKG